MSGSKTSSFLLNFDAIGKQPEISIKGKRSYQSTLGAILTILIVLTVLAATVYFGREVWEKKKPVVNRKIEASSEPAALDLNKESWDFFFGLQYNNTLFVDNSIYTIKGRLFTFTKKTGLKPVEFNIEPCTIDSFNDSNKDLFGLYKFTGAWCVSKNNTIDLKISKLWGQEDFKFIEISIWPCNNDTSSTICSDQETIKKTLEVGSFSIYTLYYFIDSTNFKEPYSKSIYNDFIAVSYKTFVHSILKLYHSEIVSDVGFLLQQQDNLKSFGVDSMKINYYSSPEADGRYLRFQYQLQNFKEVYERNYLKLQEVCAQVGGFINLFFISGFLINYLYCEINYREYLVNKFFDFDYTDKYTKKKSSSNLQSNINDDININFNSQNESSYANNMISKLDRRNKTNIESNFFNNTNHNNNKMSEVNIEKSNVTVIKDVDLNNDQFVINKDIVKSRLSKISEIDNSKFSSNNNNKFSELKNQRKSLKSFNNDVYPLPQPKLSNKNESYFDNNSKVSKFNSLNNSSNNKNNNNQYKKNKDDMLDSINNSNNRILPNEESNRMSNLIKNFPKTKTGNNNIQNKNGQFNSLGSIKHPEELRSRFLHNNVSLLSYRIGKLHPSRNKLHLSYCEKIFYFCFSKSNHKKKLIEESYTILENSVSVENMIKMDRNILKLIYFLFTDYENYLFMNINNPLQSLEKKNKENNFDRYVTTRGNVMSFKNKHTKEYFEKLNEEDILNEHVEKNVLKKLLYVHNVNN